MTSRSDARNCSPLVKRLSGEGQGTAVTRLERTFWIVLSFQVVDVTSSWEFTRSQDSKKAEKRYKSKKKPEVISRNYRRFERGEPARVLAMEVALQRLQQSLEDENMLLDKQVFEEGVSAEVSQAFTQEELQDAGEMFRKRVGLASVPLLLLDCASSTILVYR